MLPRLPPMTYPSGPLITLFPVVSFRRSTLGTVVHSTLFMSRCKSFPAGGLVFIVFLCAVITEPSPICAQQTPAESVRNESSVRDPSDGWLDLSQFLAKPGRFVPIVIPITEPALGYGLAGAAIFLRPRTSAGSEGWARPDVTVAGGMYTSNQSRGLLAADSSTWKDGRVETVFGGGHASVNLKYFGEDAGTDDSGNSLQYNLTMSGILAKGRFRLGASHWYGGLRYLYANVESSVVPTEGSSTDSDDSPEPPAELGRTDRLAGPAVALRYDSRNNILTPTKGFFSETMWSYFDRSFGGTLNFQRFEQVVIAYHAGRRSVDIRSPGRRGFQF